MNNENRYMQGINKVLRYIRDHPGEPVSLAKLAALGHFSPYHFHRIISAYLNEPLYAYIKKRRLARAAQLLRYTRRSVTDIALSVGYGTPASFSEAFRKEFGLSASSYKKRHAGRFRAGSDADYEQAGFTPRPVIKILEDQRVVYIRVFGAYEAEKIGRAWERLLAFCRERQLLNGRTALYGISYDNPDIHPDGRYEYNACIAVDREVEPRDEIGVKTLPGGKYAVFQYRGPYANLNRVYHLIFNRWLPGSRHVLRDTEIFDRYAYTPESQPSGEPLTVIHVPVE